MKKLLGIFLFLLGIYALLLISTPGARSARNHFDLGQDIGLFSILSLGVGLVIIAGGIDLSIGSVVGLCATVLAILMTEKGWSPFAALGAVLLLGAAIGLVNGLLITKLKLQPFVVTLCGLFIYRGAARWIAGEQNKGLGTQFPELKAFFKGSLFGVPNYLLLFLALAAVMTVFLHLSIYGRYLYAIGSNEKAARYAGVKTDRMKIVGYVLCSLLAAWFAFLYLIQFNAAQPSETGNFYELYAIAGAVLGGCSLRGGEGMVAGFFIGTCIIRILPNASTMYSIPSSLEPVIIGTALLVGAIMDETIRQGGWRKLIALVAGGGK